VIGLGSSDFLAKVGSFTLIIFKISCLRYLIINALGVGNRFLNRVLEEEKDRVIKAIFITAIAFAISIA
jgi:uncharacterized membrane protein